MKLVAFILTCFLAVGATLALTPRPIDLSVDVYVPGLQTPIPCKSGQYTQDWGRIRADLYRIGGITTCYSGNQIAWVWHHPTKW